MTRAAALKTSADSIRAVDYISLSDLDQAATAAKALCSVCHAKPRAAGGKMTSCLDCLRADVDVERQQREVLEAKVKEKGKSKAPATTKTCRSCKSPKALSKFAKHGLSETDIDTTARPASTPLQRSTSVSRRSRRDGQDKTLPATKACRACKVEKPLSSFSKHRLAKDGHRNDCKTCVKAERTKRRELTEAQRAADAAHRRKPHRRAVNRAAVRAWTQRNPMAARARRLLRKALKAGKVQQAEHCQAKDCSSTRRMEAHHADYSRPYVVVWLCAAHHRRAHWSGVLHLDESVPRRRARIPRLN